MGTSSSSSSSASPRPAIDRGRDTGLCCRPYPVVEPLVLPPVPGSPDPRPKHVTVESAGEEWWVCDRGHLYLCRLFDDAGETLHAFCGWVEATEQSVGRSLVGS